MKAKLGLTFGNIVNPESDNFTNGLRKQPKTAAKIFTYFDKFRAKNLITQHIPDYTFIK